jgi:RNA polymerase sigma-70 factor (ECF subfamily)
MLAHVQTASFRRFAPVSPGGVLLRMNREPEAMALDALLVRVADGRDRAAFAALFAHFAPRIKAYLMRLGAAPVLAEDLAQEAMLTLWRKAHLFDASKASCGTWLFTIARNLRIDALRRERRPELDPDDFLPDAEPEPDAVISMADGEGRLRDALKTLPPDQALVIELSFFADKPHSQIADELSIPLGTVKSRLRLAMTRLRGALGEMP